LLSGAYSLHGGVIREGGGRIVAHLATSGESGALNSLVPGVNVLGTMLGNGQLIGLGSTAKQVQSTLSNVVSIASTGAMLSGLGLVTSIAGFAFLHMRLDEMGARLAKLANTVEEIMRLITSQQYASLRVAVDTMQHAELSSDLEVRRGLLLQAKRDFTNLIYLYGYQWNESSNIKELPFLEDCYTLAYTGASLATSELGMSEVAASEFRKHYENWLQTAKKHVAKQLDHPPRRAGRMAITRLKEKLGARDKVLQANAAHLDFLDVKRLKVSEFSKDIESCLQQLNAPAVCVFPDSVLVGAHT
jgi:hypothetical protein